MQEMVFEWVVGSSVSQLSLTQPTGASGSIQIILNRMYHGQVVRYNGEWLFYLNRNSEIGSFEILTLREALSNEEKTSSANYVPAAVPPKT